MKTSEFKIYVASLDDYNAMILHGVWLTLSDFESCDELGRAVGKMLKESPHAKETGEPAEEYALHDFEGFEGLSEWTSISEAWAIYKEACEAEERGLLEQMYAYRRCVQESATLEEIEDAYVGEYESEIDFADEYVHDNVDADELPAIVAYHIDMEGVARDLFMDSYVFADGFVFCRQ